MIAIQNLYYLLLYAWDALDEAETLAITPDPETRLVDLLASVVHRGTDHLLRRGLDRNYLACRETIPGIRGKLDISGTMKANLLRRARAVCEFDDLSHDVLHNRIIKETLRKLLQARSLNRKLRAPIRATYHRLHQVGEMRLRRRDFRSVQLHRNNRSYRLLLDVCRLLHHCLIPDEPSGQFLFRSFVRDEKRMRALFEQFVRNFFRREQHAFDVAAESLGWEETTGTAADIELLPRMRTDVSLSRRGQTIVIDAKFYREPLQQHHGHWTVPPGHLYQIFAYVKNVAARVGPSIRVEGLLLYPEAMRPLDLDFQIHGHRVRVCTLNLRQHWSKIQADLLALLPT